MGDLRRRVEDVGGSIDVQTAPGKGTRIEVRVPIEEPVGEGRDQVQAWAGSHEENQ
jgi:NarL family two-component system sensor histidine kinase LiaS